MQKELRLINSCDLPDSYASITTGLNTEDSNTADPWQGPEICSTGFPDLLEATDG